MKNFQQVISDGYAFSGDKIQIGVALQNDMIFTDLPVNIPLSTLNRHGLISGATGTGKTKTIQKFLESLSKQGVPSVMMDIKGDISGVAVVGEKTEKLEGYIQKFGENFDWKAQGFPTEFFALSDEGGSPFRATISEFGPILLSRVLGLSSVQSASLAIIFRYADENGLLLVDLDDLKTLLSYVAQNREIMEMYGQISSATVQVIMRQVMQLEAQGVKKFFGERSLEMSDIMQIHDGMGQINVIRLMNSIRFPQLFSTAMIQLLLELFYSLPEVGDLSKPKLVVVIDEAHLFFKDLSSDLLSEIEMVMKLIRSKGVGIIFCTQNPDDIPDSILAQLGLKIQHTLRAFTAKDQEVIKKMAKNFPITEFYNVSEQIMSLGIGEALVTTIGENGQPTPLVVTKILPPESRMDTISPQELNTFLSISPLFMKYSQEINPESASEILSERIAQMQMQKQQQEEEKLRIKEENERKRNPTIMDSLVRTTTKTVGTQLAREIGNKIGGKQMGSMASQIVRGVLGSIFR